LAQVVKCDKLALSTRTDAHETATHMLADEKTPVEAESNSVRLERRASDALRPTVLAPTPTRIAGSVAAVKSSFARVPHRALGSEIALCYLPQSRGRIDQGSEDAAGSPLRHRPPSRFC